MQVSFKVKNEDGLFEDYSVHWDNLQSAITWYYKWGIPMSKKFNRKLYLVRGGREEVSEKQLEFYKNKYGKDLR